MNPITIEPATTPTSVEIQADSIRLYERWGFRKCAAFEAYARMPAQAIATSVFYEKSRGQQP